MKLSERLCRAGESATLVVQAAVTALRAKGVDVIDLGVGEPDFPTPKPAIDGAFGALEGGKTKYTATAGIPELRDAIAARYAGDYGGPWRREHVVVTAGAKQALYNVFMAVLDPGDEVVVAAPCWVSFADQIRLAGAEARFVHAGPERRFVPDPADIERAIGPKTRAVVLNSPSNPTGAVLPRETLAAICEVVRQRDLLLVFDETYERLVYGPEGHVSAAVFHRLLGERMVVVNSFSKSYAMTGLRIGFVVCDPVLARAVASFQSHTTSNASSVAQHAALGAILGPQDAVGEMLREYRQRRDRVIAGLAGIPGVDLVPPEGAFYAFPRVEGAMERVGIKGSLALAEWLLGEVRVAVVPGAAFEAEGFLRLSFATRSDLLDEGLRRIRRALG
jgi:aspartate aminotransferase